MGLLFVTDQPVLCNNSEGPRSQSFSLSCQCVLTIFDPESLLEVNAGLQCQRSCSWPDQCRLFHLTFVSVILHVTVFVNLGGTISSLWLRFC